MVAEGDILIDINDMVYKFLIGLYETKISISQIKNDIKFLDNNFFLEENDNIYGKLLNLFDEDAIYDLIQDISQFKNIVTNKLDNVCNHEWINDYIDIDPDKSLPICYCKHCEISKKD